jgi:hypothetical protein
VAVNGKQKGSGFERDICKALSLWVSHGASVDLYWRSAMSGGRATVAKGAVRQVGDITAVAPEGHVLTDQFSIETKHLADIGLTSLLKGTAGFKVIWQQARIAAGSRKIPLVILKQNNRPSIVCSTRCGSLLLGFFDNVKLISGEIHIALLEDMLSKSFSRDEVWVGVPSLENNYQVSSLGRIRNISRHRRKDNGILQPSEDAAGYMQVGVGGRLSLLHRLVCCAFHGAPGADDETNHKDGVKSNCSPINLEWVSSSENNFHRHRILNVATNKGFRHTPEAIEKMREKAKSRWDISFAGFTIGQTVKLSALGLEQKQNSIRYQKSKNWESKAGTLTGFTKDGLGVRVLWEGHKVESQPVPISHISP